MGKYIYIYIYTQDIYGFDQCIGYNECHDYFIENEKRRREAFLVIYE